MQGTRPYCIQALIIYWSSKGAAPTRMFQYGQSQKKCNKCKCMNAFWHAQMLTSLLSVEKLISSFTTICRSPTGFRGNPYHLGNTRKRACITCSRFFANNQVCLPIQVHCMLHHAYSCHGCLVAMDTLPPSAYPSLPDILSHLALYIACMVQSTWCHSCNYRSQI